MTPPKDWDKTLTKYGVATVIALFLVWWITGDVSGALKSIKGTLEEHVSENNFYLRQVCLNTATTESQRVGCIPPRERIRRE